MDTDFEKHPNRYTFSGKNPKSVKDREGVTNKEKISIESATLAGDILGLLNNIIQVESEQIFTHQGVSPHIWVEFY